jgi:hypothetical protein
LFSGNEEGNQEGKFYKAIINDGFPSLSIYSFNEQIPFLTEFSGKWNPFLSGNQMGDRFDSIRQIPKKEAILKDI